jgi:hypothetical protein
MNEVSDVPIIFPMYYIFKVVHRDGTTEVKNVLGKPNMTEAEKIQFLKIEKKRYADERK